MSLAGVAPRGASVRLPRRPPDPRSGVCFSRGESRIRQETQTFLRLREDSRRVASRLKPSTRMGPPSAIWTRFGTLPDTRPPRSWRGILRAGSQASQCGRKRKKRRKALSWEPRLPCVRGANGDKNLIRRLRTRHSSTTLTPMNTSTKNPSQTPPSSGHHLATISHEGRFWDVYLEFDDDPRRPDTYRALLCYFPGDPGDDEEAVRTIGRNTA